FAPLTFRDVIIRRTAQEVSNVIAEKKSPIIVNFGVGIPAEVPALLSDEGLHDYIYSTVEAGPWGGVPLRGANFGLSMGPFAIIPLPDQFTLYEGGMIDLAVLGFMEIDHTGSVNPSTLKDKITGPGGFPVIVSGSPRIIFSGAFTSGKPEIEVTMKGINIRKDGGKKFVKDAYKILFSTKNTDAKKKEVIYITERAVFKLNSGSVILTETAPGIDIEKDIMDMMEFRPKISESLTEMDRAIFRSWKLGLSRKIPRHSSRLG
ncbi:propionate CoA-transferase, partial [mine drainage metagenome]